MQPLHGIRVIDLTRVLSSPLCTMTLANLGAEVIKIEPPSGDDTRQWGPPFAIGKSIGKESCCSMNASFVFMRLLPLSLCCRLISDIQHR